MGIASFGTNVLVKVVVRYVVVDVVEVVGVVVVVVRSGVVVSPGKGATATVPDTNERTNERTRECVSYSVSGMF